MQKVEMCTTQTEEMIRFDHLKHPLAVEETK